MADRAQMELLLQSVPAWNAWRTSNPTCLPDLSGADLKVGTGYSAQQAWPTERSLNDLRYANLSKTDLRGADLSGLDITHTDFTRSDLRGAQFAGNYFARTVFARANLREINLAGSNLHKASFEDADMTCANLTNSQLVRVNLTGTNLTDANLSGAYIATDYAEGAKLYGADLRGITFPGLEESVSLALNMGGYSLLGFAFADGLDEVRAGSDRVIEYVSLAFAFAHHPRATDLGLLPPAFDRVKALRSLFADARTPGTPLATALRSVDAELIRYLARNPTELHQVHPRQFEELIAEVLAGFGWRVDLTAQTRDGGVDIIAISPASAGVSTSWLIECKKHSPENKVDLKIVRALYGLRCEQNFGGALLATTSSFTEDARDYKSTRYNLHFRDYEGVIDWIN